LIPQDCKIDITYQAFYHDGQMYYVEGMLSSVISRREFFPFI